MNVQDYLEGRLPPGDAGRVVNAIETFTNRVDTIAQSVVAQGVPLEGPELGMLYAVGLLRVLQEEGVADAPEVLTGVVHCMSTVLNQDEPNALSELFEPLIG